MADLPNPQLPLKEGMVERCARAFLKAGPDDEAWVGDSDEHPDLLSAMTIDGYVDMIAGVRAVLEALLSPTGEMVEAGAQHALDEMDDPAPSLAIETWSAMLLEALKEG